jgi:hypothetical protein
MMPQSFRNLDWPTRIWTSVSEMPTSGLIASKFCIIAVPSPSHPSSLRWPVCWSFLFCILSLISYFLIEFSVEGLGWRKVVFQVELGAAVPAVEVFFRNPVNRVIKARIMTYLEIAMVANQQTFRVLRQIADIAVLIG